MSEENDEKPVVVAHLESDVPYSCVSSSPDGRLVIMGGKDTVRIVSLKPSGLKEVRSIRISQFFQAQRTSRNQIGGSSDKNRKSVRDVFSAATAQNASPAMINVDVSDVAWSICQTQDEDDQSIKLPDHLSTPELSASRRNGKGDLQDYGHDTKNDPFEAIFSMPGDLRMADDSLIAAAGSNGTVLVWRACDLLRGLYANRNKQADVYKHFYGNFGAKPFDQSSSSIGYPEAVLVEHSKAVKVAWHPHLPNLLLTASLDGTAKLWERSEDVDTDSFRQPVESKWSWLGALSTSQFDDAQERSFSWKCKQVFKPNCGGIREVKWSSFSDDLFAMVTNNGFLVVYYTIVPHRPTVRIAAHAREATTLDWHPTKPYVIATGGVDMKVKVWDLEDELSLSNFDDNLGHIHFNQNQRSNRSQDSSGCSSSNGTSPPKSPHGQDSLDHSYHGQNFSSFQGEPSLTASRSTHNFAVVGPQTIKKAHSPFQPSLARHGKNSPSKLVHELSVSAQVEKLKWRPPKRPIVSADRSRYLLSTIINPDHHEAMLAVATTVTGATSGGCGKVYLWSCQRPFMPLSIVDGHEEKSVADFIWLDTPQVKEIGSPRRIVSLKTGSSSLSLSRRKKYLYQQSSSVVSNEGGVSLTGTWQHVLTVGRDGKCLVQSFCRGEKSISKVPPSAFAIAELSPFQKGFGSLQLIATHQNVPSGASNEFEVCGFRRDNMSAKAPGIFKEEAVHKDNNKNAFQWDPNLGGLKYQSDNLDLTFSTTDSGDLNSIGTKPKSGTVVIAPEVVHLSRFADSYKLRKDSTSKTKAAMSRYNSNVARQLNCMALAQMWSMLASLLEGSGSEDLADANPKKGFPRNAFSFALLPTLKKLLIERADAGDVQTCVVICEVMEVIPKKSPSANVTLAVPGLNLMLVRQWYLSYIELLQQMCLFSHATNLIRLCHDPEINKLNQQSTTFHESCPTCSKPLQRQDTSCRSCRQKIGLCFLCHEPVKGVFVWCPGCGHGGHLEHALEWFGGNNADKIRELCPTGCGHRCNLIQVPAGSALCQPKQ